MLRFLAIISLLLVIVSAVAFIRYQTALPYIDRLRFGYWMWGEEWSDLANSLWEMRDADELYCLFEDDDCRVEAMRYRDVSWPEEIPLAPETRTQLHHWMRAGHLYELRKWESYIQVPTRDVDKLDRWFSIYMIWPRDGFVRSRECDGQFRTEHEGSCEIALGTDWILRYDWRLTIPQQQAKCFGVWREYGQPPTSFNEIEVYRYIGSEEEYGWAEDDLGREVAARFAETGARELLAARSEGSIELVEQTLEPCLLLF